MQRFKKQEHQRIDFKLLAKAQTRRDEEEQADTVTASAQDCKRRGVFFFLTVKVASQQESARHHVIAKCEASSSACSDSLTKRAEILANTGL